MSAPDILYSTPTLVRASEETGVVYSWQAHLSRVDGQWIGWSVHGDEAHPTANTNEIARSGDVWDVVEAINERLDGRAARGYQAPLGDFAWVGSDLADHLAAQGIHVAPQPSVDNIERPVLSDLGQPAGEHPAPSKDPASVRRGLS